MFSARDLLATPSHEGLSYVVDQLFKPEETYECQSAQALYKFCVTNFSNCLTLMLLNVYLHSSDDLNRFRAICLLSETLTCLRNLSSELSLVALDVIKPLLVSCLTMPEARKPDTKMLRRIVSCVARNVVEVDRNGWDELGDCMLTLVNTDPLRAFNIFLDLPLLGDGFLNRFLKDLVEEIDEVLLNPEKDRDNEEYWTLALETSVKLGIQLSDSKTGFDLAREILGTVFKSADNLVMHGKEEFLQRGLAHLVKFLAQDVNMCRYSRNQCEFVSEFAFNILGIGKHTHGAARKIYQMVTKLENSVCNQAFKLSDSVVENQGFDLDLYNKLNTLSALEILRMVASTTMDDKSREIAVGRLHYLLCDHTSNRAKIDVSEMRQMKKPLMSCLTEVGVPENTFKLLGKVVFHVALELLCYQEDRWFDLWDYIAAECESEFERTAYIFQCLTMMVNDKEYVIPAVNNLLPEIRRRLINSPGELLVDNSGWVLAFVSGFCAAIHLFESDIDTADEILDKMVDSVRELVERDMEVGLVRRGFRDLESIVKKQVESYNADEYKLVKDLLWELYEIKGLRMESKMVLWRINVFLEKGTQFDKEFPESFTQ
ncbi:unnamed protein product [Eruca vesicaria subsp. sativa]|uniref:DUF577 domain-containing protein n=1 Tax=Eruca vesicaria subsp. sativa TaxID=29727 RepID=A0ABC8K0M5_ERUVS|nr:unnamed protein product [Eruca vesicaria subsp. sativa]